MFTEISAALQDFAKERTTKGEFTRLELLLARIREKPEFNALEFDRFLAGLVQEDDVANGDFAMGISLIAAKTGCHGSDFRNAIEQELWNENNVLSPRSQYELSNLLIKCGGEFTQVHLNRLTCLKTEIPELWLDMAIKIHSDHPQYLLDEINALLLDKARPMQWESLKPRYLKITEIVSEHDFNEFITELAKNLHSGESREFLEWIDKKRNTE